jgi:hypothetical protein
MMKRSPSKMRNKRSKLRGGLSSRVKNALANGAIGGLLLGRSGAIAGAALGGIGNVGFFKDRRRSRSSK